MWLLLAGCASSPITASQSNTSEIIDYPQVGITVTRSLGDRLVAKGIRVTGPALEVVRASQFGKKQGDSSKATCAITVSSGTYFKRGIYATSKVQGDCYGPVSYRATLEDGTTNWNCNGQAGIGDICFNKNSDDIFLTVSSRTVPLEQDFDNLRLTTGVVEDSTNFVQELVYNGRVDDDLRFVYREFSDNIIRPAFTQEVQYDFSESPVIGFKEMRLKVINATNTTLTYQLIRNF